MLFCQENFDSAEGKAARALGEHKPGEGIWLVQKGNGKANNSSSRVGSLMHLFCVIHLSSPKFGLNIDLNFQGNVWSI